METGIPPEEARKNKSTKGYVILSVNMLYVAFLEVSAFV
jgi:hypothetical protein